MASSSAQTGKHAAIEELTDPGYSDEGEDAPVTLDELYEAVAELRGLVMVLAEPVILRLQAKEAQQAKRQAASDAENSFPSTVLGYFKQLSKNAAVVADATAPARQMVIDAMAATPQATTAAKTAVNAYRAMTAGDKRRMRGFYLAHCDTLPDPVAMPAVAE
jgi:hypothetical protein